MKFFNFKVVHQENPVLSSFNGVFYKSIIYHTYSDKLPNKWGAVRDSATSLSPAGGPL